jgi:DNA-binding PucR family transcriptional regulator
VAVIAARGGGAIAGELAAAVDAWGDVAPNAVVHATVGGGAIAALVGVADDRGEDELLELARHAVAGVCERLRRRADLVAGISSVRRSVDEYADAYAEAQQVVECIRGFALGPAPDVFTAADLGPGRVFLATSDRDAVLQFADAAFGGLVRDPSKVDLLTTLQAFFDNMASIRRAAEQLEVHENTIRYRLSRIEELTGLAITHDPDAQLGARLSLLVLMLQGRLPAPGATSHERSPAAQNGPVPAASPR